MEDFERLAGLLGARRSTDPPPIPLSKDGLMAAFVAFGSGGTDEENQIIVLKLMKAIEAYLRTTAHSAPD